MWRIVGAPLGTLPHSLGGVLLCGASLAPGGAAADPTWADNARGMIERCCVRCHDGAGPGAYPLRTPEEVAAKRGTVLKVLELHTMPPFLPTRASLVARPPEPTADELALFQAWCEAGAPIGDDRNPARVAAATDVHACDPLALTNDFPITPEEQRTMRSFQVPLGNEAPVLVGGVRVTFDEPGLIARVHLNAVPADEARRLDEIDSSPGFRLTGDGAGSPAGSLGGCGIDGEFRLPPGYALAIPAGSALIAEAHADGRGKTEAGGFTVTLLAPTPMPSGAASTEDGATPSLRTCEPLLVAAQQAEWDVASGLDHSLRTAPLSRGCTVIGIALRPGVYATSAHLAIARPGEEPGTIVDIPRFDIHQDQPYLLAEPLSVPAGSRFMLSTGHLTEAAARKSLPQAVLLVVPDTDAGSSIAALDQAGPQVPALADVAAPLNALVAGATRIGNLHVTRELTCAEIEALLHRAGEASTGGVASCGLTWFDAVAAANALSAATGLAPRYVLSAAHSGGDSGAITGASVARLPGNGWRLPTDEEWSMIAASGACPDAVGSLWEWCDTESGGARESRIVRGGCWADTEAARAPSARAAIEPSTRSELFGARLVRRVGAADNLDRARTPH